MTPDEYDRELASCECMADDDILVMVTGHPGLQSSAEEDEEEGQDDEGKSDGRVAAVVANSALKTLMRYFEQNELSTADDTKKLSIIKLTLCVLCLRNNPLFVTFLHLNEICVQQM